MEATIMAEDTQEREREGRLRNKANIHTVFKLLVSLTLAVFLCLECWIGSVKHVVPVVLNYRLISSPSLQMITNGSIWNESKFNESKNSELNFSNWSEKGLHENTPEKPCVKQIQLWADFPISVPVKEYNCPEENCKARFVYSYTYDKMKTSDVVILHHRGSWNWESLARFRPDGQLWIFMTMESPIHTHKLPAHLAQFNWSMTYRAESDFVIPYGRYIEGSPEIQANDSRNWASGKTRLIAWMASNCGVTSWGRTKFVQNLERLIQVDTYGACGKLKCPRNQKCGEILSSHKFYLALENSECQDYITEKFWRNAFVHNLVPIVYGTTREEYEKVAPPNSFIHLSDFRNMTSLVDYIKYLDTNDTAYNEYFEWRKRGSVISLYEEVPKDLLCPIVQKLRGGDFKKQRKEKTDHEIVDIKNWWTRSCMHRGSVWAP